VKVEKVAKNRQMVQNCYPLSPGVPFEGEAGPLRGRGEHGVLVGVHAREVDVVEEAEDGERAPPGAEGRRAHDATSCGQIRGGPARDSSLPKRTLVVRAYSGGPETGEVVKTHRDHVIDENGEEDTRRVVSVVLVLEGGFRDSGYDVRVHGDGGKFFFPHLETGGALALEGGP
jgi:hypothetical protein